MTQLTNKEFRDDTRSESEVPYVHLLTLSGPQIDTIRIVDRGDDLTVGGKTYNAFPFVVSLPQQTGQTPPEISIKIDVVDQTVMEQLRKTRGSRGKKKITIEVVDADHTDDVYYGPAEFNFISMETDDSTTATIKCGFLFGALDDAYPVGRFSQANAVSN